MLKTLAALSLLLLSIHAALICDPTEEMHSHEEIEATLMAEADKLGFVIP
jgi:hypothetical protein